MSEGFEWQREFEYLLHRKILSRDELAELLAQIKSIINREKQAQSAEIEKLKDNDILAAHKMVDMRVETNRLQAGIKEAIKLLDDWSIEIIDAKDQAITKLKQLTGLKMKPITIQKAIELGLIDGWPVKGV